MHYEELAKIQRATSGFFKRKARQRVAAYLGELAKELDLVARLDVELQHQAKLNLLNRYTGLRHIALRNGARGYGDADWAAASACESWMFTILQYPTQERLEVEMLIREMMNTD